MPVVPDLSCPLARRKRAVAAEPSADGIPLACLLAHTPVPVALCSPDTGKVLLANRKLEQLAGRASLGGAPLTLLFAPRWREPLRARLTALPPGGADAMNAELQITGEPPLLVQVKLARTDGDWGVVTAMITTTSLQDDRAPDLVRDRALLRSLIDSIPDYIFMKDPDGVYLGCNRAFEARTGQVERGLVGRTDHDVFPPAEADLYREKDREMLASGRPMRVEEEVELPDGTRQWFDTVKTPFFGPDGRVLGLVGICRDITSRKRAEEELRLADAVFAGSSEACLLAGRDGRLLRANPAFTRITGWAAAELIDPAGHLAPPWRDLVAEAGHLEARIAHRDGRELWIEGTRSLVPDDDGGVLYHILQFSDVTDDHRRDQERRALEEQLRRSQRMETVGRLAGGVAHDFNNMLSVIVSTAELVRGRSEEPKSREGAQVILGAATRAAELTRRLMIFGRRDFDVPGVVDLNGVIRCVEPLVRRSVGEDVTFELRLQDGLPGVLMGAPHLEQILVNLAINARDAMPGGGRLLVRTAAVDVRAGDEDGLTEGRWVRLEVEDDGEGMTPEVLALVFEPFFTTKKERKGTGLGLSIVHHIVEAARGHIHLRSAPGQGTRVIIHLPSAGAAPRHVARGDARQDIRGRGERVLLVEDERSLLELLAEVLRESGYATTAIADPAAALERIRRDPGSVDLLVTDVVMPGMAGPELVRRARAIRPDLRVVFMSGHTDERLARHDLGGAAFLQKPFRVEDLQRALRRLLDGG